MDTLVGVLLVATFVAMIAYCMKGGNLLVGFIVTAVLWCVIGMVPMDNLVGRASVVIFSVDGSANWYNPASWIKAVRWNRVGERI